MAFESLTERFQGILKKLRGQSRLTEANMDAMLKEIQRALLEADVNFKVVREFTNNVKEKAIGQEVFKELNPSQMVVKIVHDELVDLLGSDETKLEYLKGKATFIMLVGLQGSGKTTTAGKLAKRMKEKDKKKVLLVAADVYRPAAIDQLSQIGKQIGVDVFSLGTNVTPVEIATQAKEKARIEHYDVVIIDTAGRLTIDEPLMQELRDIREIIEPQEILLLVDAMSGQDAVNTAKQFNKRLELSGVIMSKLDGDARGGAALSIRHISKVPIKFAGVGEKLDDLEPFYPERMADRILGMGDVVTLVEKVQENIDEREMKKSVNKMLEGHFSLNDMLEQMKQIQKMGPLRGILKLIPGMPKIDKEHLEIAEKQMRNFEIIMNSMTPEERENPAILKHSRKVRIAKGSGTSTAAINRMLKQYDSMKDAMKKMQQYKKTGRMPPGF
ncbi:MAG: signal recognition particle protein [Erysipelotrichaceae bacterium]|nr:signal recognition particle protein [Erysipelotrichaceae bacterium]